MTRKGEAERNEKIMAYDAKYSFLMDVEKRLSSEVTADAMHKALSIIADMMEGYEMRQTMTDNDEKDDLFDCYMSAMKVQGRSEKTLKQYDYVIRKFMAAVKVPTRRVTVYHVRNYLAAEKARGLQDSTIESIRQPLSAYFKWLQLETLIERNPMANVGAIKCAKKKRKCFSDIELELITRNCKCTRDRAIILFLDATGCRISEMVELNREQVDLDNMKCVVHGKGNKERVVYFDAVTGLVLRDYLTSRTDCNDALFVSEKRPHNRFLDNGVRTMMKKIAKASGVDHIHPHKFRRTLATYLHRHGMSIEEIARVLGHEKIDTTMRYIVQNDAEVESAYRKIA